jgi:hypothetical protein
VEGLLLRTTKTLLVKGTAYTVTVGAGGAAVNLGTNEGNPGNNSVFATITSTGGGYGGKYVNPVGTTGGTVVQEVGAVLVRVLQVATMVLELQIKDGMAVMVLLMLAVEAAVQVQQEETPLPVQEETVVTGLSLASQVQA